MAKKPLKDALRDGTVSVEYCLQRKSKQDRIYMAKHGLYIDKLIALNDPRLLIELIKNDHAKEHYDAWKTHKDGEVRRTLAYAGYFPNHFIQDKNKRVQKAVLNKHPEYCGVLLNRSNKSHWEHIAQMIDENWSLRDIKTFLDAQIPDGAYSPRLTPIRTYYQAVITVPTLIEKTMSPAQLFKSESPLWAHGRTIYRIQQVQELYKRIKHDKQKKDEFYKLFDDLLNNETHYWTACHIEEL